MDSRGQSARLPEMAQTFLTAAEIVKLTVTYEAGAPPARTGQAVPHPPPDRDSPSRTPRRSRAPAKSGLCTKQRRPSGATKSVARPCNWAASSRWTRRPCVEPSHDSGCRSDQMDDLVGRGSGNSHNSTFEPQLVKKRQRRLSDMDLILSLFVKGLTTGEIAAHFAEVHGTSVSKDTIS